MKQNENKDILRAQDKDGDFETNLVSYLKRENQKNKHFKYF